MQETIAPERRRSPPRWLNENAGVYNKIAEEVCAEMTAALQAVSVEDEPNPVKTKWYC